MSITLSSSVTGIVYTWTYTEAANISGASACSATDGSCGTSIVQGLSNSTNSSGTATYTITPYVDGCAGTAAGSTVTVYQIPVASATSKSSCSGTATSIALTSSIGASTFAYSGSMTSTPSGGTINNIVSGTVTPIAQSLVNTGNSRGIATYSVVATANGCSSSVLLVNDTVKAKPAVIVSQSATLICSGTGAGITLSALDSIAPTYTWTIAQTGVTGATACASSCGSSINQTLTNSGTTIGTVTYSITPTSDGCAGAVFAQTDSVRPATTPSPTYAVTPTYGLCSSYASGYTYSVTSPQPGETFSWTLPANMTVHSGSNNTSSSITVDVNSSFVSGSLKVTGTTSTCGGSTSYSATVYASYTGMVISSTYQNTGDCGATGGSFYANPLSQTGASYAWTVPSSMTIISGQSTQKIYANFTSSFVKDTVICVISNACGVNATLTYIASSAPLTPGTISGSATLCRLTSTTYSITAVAGASSYTWTLPTGDSAITYANASSYTTSSPSIGVYAKSSAVSGNISVTANSSCGTSSAAKTLAITYNCREMSDGTTVADQPAGLDMVAYPNPAHDKLNVVFNSNSVGKYTVRMIDITGRMVLNQQNTTQEGTNVLEIDLTNYAKGIYTLSLITSEGSKQVRLTVE